MNGISGIVATAILLALTIAGGVIIYGYVTSYLNTMIQDSKLIVENAYYLSVAKKLIIEARNIGSQPVSIESIMLINVNGNSSYFNKTAIVNPGERITLEINIDNDVIDLPQFVLVKYNSNVSTEPIRIRVF
ncbi:MAG: hypothetical protein QXE81_03460 [Desulfurococcaceae archaeon]